MQNCEIIVSDLYNLTLLFKVGYVSRSVRYISNELATNLKKSSVLLPKTEAIRLILNKVIKIYFYDTDLVFYKHISGIFYEFFLKYELYILHKYFYLQIFKH